MEQLNTNQNNTQDIQTKTGAQNLDKKANYAKNTNSERNRHNSKFAQKSGRGKGTERTKEGQVMKSQNQSFGNGSTTSQGRFSKRNGQNGEGNGKYKANRVETIEDIMADIERVEKDIQFEIKQIRAIKLGL
ncbi:MAG: hypothetical protein GXX10_12130 [Clostridiaceae bacterium]|nr:hypothetical protein [Clostridiaceae bacterium]